MSTTGDATHPVEDLLTDESKSFTDTEREWLLRIAHLSPEELHRMARRTRAIKKRLATEGPRTDAELLAHIERELGLHIPRVAVCEGHCAPSDFICDAWFRRERNFLVVANRGGAKTQSVAVLWDLTGQFRPGVEGVTLGAIQAQADRCHEHLKRFLRRPRSNGKTPIETDVESCRAQSTEWTNGTRVFTLCATMNSVNGPHPQILHSDEVDRFHPVEVFYESRHMSKASFDQNGNEIPSQNFLTSTRKTGSGLMARLVRETEQIKKRGLIPPYVTMIWCVFETAKRQPNCRTAPENKDRPDGELCQCHRIVKGRWDEDGAARLGVVKGEPRRFDQVCAGRLARSDGWIPLDDVWDDFQSISQGSWEAQSECINPSTEGMVLPKWKLEEQGVVWTPDPANGPIYQGLDWGGQNPHAAVWVQVTTREVVVPGGFNTDDVADGPLGEIVVPINSRVVFAEIYKSRIPSATGANSFAQLIVNQEAAWRARWPNFWVEKRFPDPAGADQRIAFAAYDPPLPTEFFISRDVKDHIAIWRGLMDDGLFFVDVRACEWFCREAPLWHYPERDGGGTEDAPDTDPEIPVNEFDHLMSSGRYCLAHVDRIEKIERRGSFAPGATGAPHQTAKVLDETRKAGALISGVGGHTGGSQMPPGEAWRLNLLGGSG